MQSYMSTQSRQPDPAFTWSNMLTQSQQPDPDNHIVVHADTQSTTRPNQPYMPTYIRQPGSLLRQANRLLGRPPPSFIWSRSTINHIKVGVSRSTSFQYASSKLNHFGQPSNTPTSITWDAKPWKQHPLGCNRKHEHTNCAWTQSPSRCVLITI